MDNEFETMYAALMEEFSEAHSSINRIINAIDALLEQDIKEAQEAERLAFENIGRAQLILESPEKDLAKVREAKYLLLDAECKLRDTFFPLDDDGSDKWEAENKRHADIVAKMLQRVYTMERFYKKK